MAGMRTLCRTVTVRVSRVTPPGIYRRYIPWPPAGRAPCASSCVVLSRGVRSMSLPPPARRGPSLRPFPYAAAVSLMGDISPGPEAKTSSCPRPPVRLRPTAGSCPIFPRTICETLPALGRESDRLGEPVPWPPVKLPPSSSPMCVRGGCTPFPSAARLAEMFSQLKSMLTIPAPPLRGGSNAVGPPFRAKNPASDPQSYALLAEPAAA